MKIIININIEDNKLRGINIMYDMLYDLIDGKVGKVLENNGLWDEEKECYVVDGCDCEVGKVVGDIDEWLEGKDLSKLILNRSEGYRGYICYDGIMEIDGKLFVMDIVSEYVVYELIKKG